MKNRRFTLRACVAVTVALSACGAREGGQSSHNKPGQVTIVFSCLKSFVGPAKVGPAVLAEFTRQTGILVKTLPYGEDLARRRADHVAWLGSHRSTPDLFEINIIDIPSLADHMVDLMPIVGNDATTYLPAILDNVKIGAKLAALPINTDIGVLLYRVDLLKKYRYEHPPQTWDELERMSTVIQAGERAAGNRDFWGFVWEGAPWEGLTSTALEWQFSHGGGSIIESDSTISVNNPGTIAALERARSWVNRISPPGVTAYRMEDVMNIWRAGRAAFVRSWAGAYLNATQSDSAAYAKAAITNLPQGPAGHAGTLGGWQVAVSKYSEHRREAVALARFLTSRAVQTRFVKESGWMPTRRDVFEDPDVRATNPSLGWLKNTLPSVFVVRPSGPAKSGYSAVSEAYFRAVHSVLTGEQKPREAMTGLEQQLMDITGFPRRTPTGSGAVRRNSSR